jgi:hypothetical protein
MLTLRLLRLAYRCYPDEKVPCAIELRLSLPYFFFHARKTGFLLREEAFLLEMVQIVLLAHAREVKGFKVYPPAYRATSFTSYA